MKLTIKQTEALDILEDNRTTELLFGGAAGGAKSYLGCYWQLKRRLKYPGTRGVIGRAILKTLKETTLNSFWDVCKLQGIKPNIHFKYNEQKSLISFFNGSEILLKDLYNYPKDPEFDELGSLEITDAFIDEANQVVFKAKDIVSSRIRYKLNEYDLIPKLLLTCNPAKNWVYIDFYKLDKENKLPEYRKFIQSFSKDNPHLSKHYISNLNKLDKNSKERLLFGNWEYDDDPTALINYDSILDIFTNEFVLKNRGQRYITADIAAQGSDLFVVYVWNGLAIIDIVAIKKSDPKKVEEILRDLSIKYNVPRSQIAYDADGLGTYLTGYLRGARPINNNSSPIGKENYQNLKSQLYYYLAKAINSNQIYMQCDLKSEYREMLIEDLEQVKSYDTDKDNKLRILPKDKVKSILGRSPDFSDAMAYRMIFELIRPYQAFWDQQS